MILTHERGQTETIVLSENQDSEAVELDIAERDAFAALVPGASITAIPGSESLFYINPRNNVGAVQVGAKRFVLRPKIAISRLMFMVPYSLDPVTWHRSKIDLNEDFDVFEAIVPAFVFQLEDALIQGLLQGYEPKEDAIRTVRGTIRFDDQIRSRFGLMPPVECRYDEFTSDNEANRILKAAITRLLALPLRDSHHRKRLRRLAGSFGGVSTVRYSRFSLPRVSFDRLSDRFRRPVELARLILRSESFDAGVGMVPASGFILDLSSVFEDFVATALRNSLGLSATQFPQGCEGRELFLDDRKKLRLEPDLSWWVDGRCVFIGDAKYKRTPPSAGLKHPDAYQMLAYGTAAQLRRGLLVYAAGEKRQSYFVSPANFTIRVETLDLDVQPQQVLEQVDALASIVRAQASEAGRSATTPRGSSIRNDLLASG